MALHTGSPTTFWPALGLAVTARVDAISRSRTPAGTVNSRSNTAAFHDLPTPPQSNRPSLEHHKPVDLVKKYFLEPKNSPMAIQVSKDEYHDIESSIEEIPGRTRYEYDYVTGKFTAFPNPLPAHEALIYPLGAVCTNLGEMISQAVPTARVTHRGASGTSLQNAKGRRTREKGADVSVNIQLADEDDRSFPLIVFEIGLSESVAALELDARHWLYETNGEVALVGLIKLTQPEVESHVEDWQVDMTFYQRYSYYCFLQKLAQFLLDMKGP